MSGIEQQEKQKILIRPGKDLKPCSKIDRGFKEREMKKHRLQAEPERQAMSQTGNNATDRKSQLLWREPKRRKQAPIKR